jgi:nicotinate-nucleotide adenylyltransferase
MKRIGIFGGSFNPVHLGHTALAAYICDQGLVDEVWMMVSPQNPLKRNLELLDEQHRLAMLQLAIAPYHTLQACDFEFHLPRPSYTYHTLQALREAYPDCTFSLIIGEDNWQGFDRWYRSEEILRETPLIVYPRDSVDSLEQSVERRKQLSTFNFRLSILENPPLFPYSSTEVRTALAAGSDARDMLHPAVAAYIADHHLYAPHQQ